MTRYVVPVIRRCVQTLSLLLLLALPVLALYSHYREAHWSGSPSPPPLVRLSPPAMATLREALRALAIINIVEIRQGDGTYVTSLEPELLMEPLDFVFSLDDSSLLQLFEARKVLEVGIVALAAQRDPYRLPGIGFAYSLP